MNVLPSILTGRTAHFWLSQTGKDSLKGIVDQQSFRAFVHATDEHGVWVVLTAKQKPMNENTGSVLLLKWEYLATSQIELPRATHSSAQTGKVH
ncbi:MAG TPA: hypothetical protein VFU76_01145 [Terriglobales bacterium]|nr:hypothetical protein [Terriglobales bacterium]